MTRVVADTNVLVSVIQCGGKAKQLLDLTVDGHIDLAISEAILEETVRVLKDKFHRAPEENQRDASIADQLRICREFAARRGWTVVQEFTDHAISGATLLRSGLRH